MTAVANQRSSFVKAALFLARNKGRPGAAMHDAEEEQEFVAAEILKSVVNPQDSASLLAQRASSDFAAAVHGVEIIGRLNGRRIIDFEEFFPTVDSSSATYWLAQDGLTSAPVAKLSLSTIRLAQCSVLSIVALSNAVLRLSNANAVAESELVAACADAVDLAFIDPANAGVAGQIPASVTHGATAIAATSDPAADLKKLVTAFAGDLRSSYLVCNPATATALALHVDASGGFAFPDASPRGGSAIGLPLLTSRSVPTDSSGAILALIDASGISTADDGIAIDSSSNADLAMTDDPTAGASSMTSMFQNNSIAIRVARTVNWAAAAGRVAYLHGIGW